MNESRKPSCSGCASRDAEIAAKDAEIALLRERWAAAKKDSSNSSKPPSSDIVKPDTKPPIPEGQEKRHIGGQPGHVAHFRDLFEGLDIHENVEHPLDACPNCGGGVHRNGTIVMRKQQVEIVLPKLFVTEHQFPEYWCDICGKSCRAPLPTEVERGGMAGPTLTTLVAYLKGCCHASFSTIRLFLRDVCGLTISRGNLVKIINRVATTLNAPYEELEKRLPEQDRLNVDETGHPENGKLLWTWCLKADLFTVFHISPSRGSDVLIELLGQEFDGMLGCDYFSAYRKFMRVVHIEVQFCLAHLIRDVKFLCGLPDIRDKAYGVGLSLGLKRLFEVIHRRDQMTDVQFQSELEKAKSEILAFAKQAPATQRSQNMAKRFEKHGESYFTFITTPEMDPTNNVAERAIRFVVLDRVVTQGTRGEKGQRWCERIWTVLATCQQRKISAFAYLISAVGHWMAGGDVPSLLNGPFAPA